MKPMILKMMSSNGRIQGLSAELLIMMELNDSLYYNRMNISAD